MNDKIKLEDRNNDLNTEIKIPNVNFIQQHSKEITIHREENKSQNTDINNNFLVDYIHNNEHEIFNIINKNLRLFEHNINTIEKNIIDINDSKYEKDDQDKTKMFMIKFFLYNNKNNNQKLNIKIYFANVLVCIKQKNLEPIYKDMPTTSQSKPIFKNMLDPYSKFSNFDLYIVWKLEIAENEKINLRNLVYDIILKDDNRTNLHYHLNYLYTNLSFYISNQAANFKKNEFKATNIFLCKNCKSVNGIDNGFQKKMIEPITQ
ncbi:hypothetical protein GVAV_000280 [Gurleya vavrai]